MEDLQVPQLHLKETISDLRSDFRLCPFSDRAIKTSQTAELFQAVTFIPLELSYTFMSALFSVTFHFVHFDPHTRFRMAPVCMACRLTLLVFVLFILSDLKNVYSLCVYDRQTLLAIRSSFFKTL